MDATTTTLPDSSGPRIAADAERIGLLVAGLALVLAALTIVLPPMFPCQDAPGHLLAAQVHLHPELFDGLYVAQQALTGQSFVTFTAAFGHLLPLVWAARLVLLLGLGLQAWGAVRLARITDSSVVAAIAGASLTFVGWSYVMGFFSFNLSVAFATVGWSFWLGRRGAASALIAAIFFALSAWSHSIGCGIVLAHVGLTEMLAGRWHWRQLIRWVAFVPAVGWAVWATVAGLLEHYEIGGVEEAVAVWLPAGQRLITGLLGAFGSYTRLVAPIAGLLVIHALFASREPGDDLPTVTRRATARAALVWCVVYATIPFHVLGWYFAGPRVLVGATALLTATSFSRARGAVAPLALAAAAALGLAAGLPTAWGEGQRIANSVAAFGSEPVGRTFVVTHRPESLVPIAPWARPNVGTGRYATLNGGADPGAFAFRSPKHAMHFAQPMAQLFPDTRRQFANIDGACLDVPECAAGDVFRADEVAITAVAWDSVTLVEPSIAFVEQLVLRGFVAQAPAVLRPRPSDVRLTLLLAPEDASLPVVFSAGWPQSVGPFRGGSIAATPQRPGTLTVSFAPMPAGEAVVVACADADCDGACGVGDHPLFGPERVEVEPGSTLQLGP